MMEDKLPRQINWLGKEYKLFIYRDFGWSATYALPEYFCDKCAEKYDPVMIYDYADKTIEGAISGLWRRIQKIAKQEKSIEFVY